MNSVAQTYEMAERCHNAGEFLQADRLYRQVLQTDPQHVDALHMCGVIACQTGRIEAGIASIREALRLRPDYVAAHNNLGSVLAGLEQLAEAEASFRQALHIKPDHAEAHYNLGNVLAKQGKLAEAEASYRQSLRIKPYQLEGHYNLGNVLEDQGKQDEAIAQFQQTLRLQPDCARAHWSLGGAWLRQGNFELGWPESEWRLQCEQIKPPPYRQPIWDGSSLNGRTILLYAEQGLGDVVQFIRYAPLVQARGGRVSLACPRVLMRVLADCAGIDRFIPFGTPLPPGDFDVQASLMSLPGILRTSLATVPAKVPYIFADAGLVEHWRKTIADCGLRIADWNPLGPHLKPQSTIRNPQLNLKIGIAWQGNPRHSKDARRSMPLTRFAPLARLSGVQFFSLQTGPGTEQLPGIADRFPVIDLGSRVQDFADIAAIMRNLDLFITCDSAPAHLAGALGIPVWVALSFVADWRWLRHREDSPWYPTMRLFRQSAPGNWDSVFEQMAEQLKRKGEGETPARDSGSLFPLPPSSSLFELAVHYHQTGNLQLADHCYRQVLPADPRHVDALHMLGVLLYQTRQCDAGIAHIREALRLKPDCAEAHCSLGNAFQDQRKWDEALVCYRQALHCRPHYAEAHYNLANVLIEQRNLDEALANLQEAVRLKPDFAEALNSLAHVFKEMEKLEEALSCLRRALSLNPDFAEAHCNLGNVLKNQGNVDEAVACFQRAVQLKPDDAQAHTCLGISWLIQGKFEQGWPEFEWRWKCKDFDARPYRQPLWDGSPLNGRTILLCMEQGLGDTLQFIRFAPAVQARGGRVVVACQPELIRFLANCPGVDRLLPFGTNLPLSECDVQVSLMSLPAILGTTLATVPAKIPYLFADAALTEHWRDKLAKLGNRHVTLRIGIAWQGNPGHRKDVQRSIPLAQFASVARVKGVQLFSLQKGHGSDQLVGVAEHFSVIDLSSHLQDFADTAAVMRNLDLVITCDSAPAHLAGALGVPVRVALPFAPDWRWLLHREDSPWYQTMRLFRQSKRGNWEDVFERIAAHLRKGCKGGRKAFSRSPLASAVASGPTALARGERLKEPGNSFELAVQHHKADQFQQADYLYRQILQADPRHVPALHMAGVLACQMNQYDLGISRIREALRLQPDFAEAHCNLGSAFQDLDRWDEALDCYRQSLQLNPDSAATHYNLGNVLRDQGKLDEAISSYQEALRLKQDFPLAHRDLGVAWLRKGNFEQGWPEIEWRWECECLKPCKSFAPLWDGSSLCGKTILLRAEQGFGDTLQFIRYASLVKQHGGTVRLECPEALARLLRNCSGIDGIVPPGPPAPVFDVQAPLLSLPGILQTSLQTIPNKVPYLHPDPALVEHWRKELGDDPAFKIGIIWQGNPRSWSPALRRADARRSIPLKHFESLAQVAGVRLYSLQKGFGTEQLAMLADRFPVTELGSQLNDFMDTAAVMTNLDLIISADTASAHLAGAIGVPVWTALPFASCWRWLMDRQDSPWYPTMRLFRQSEPGNWEGVFERMAKEWRAASGEWRKKTGGSPTRHSPLATRPSFELATALHKAGQFQKADYLYRQILQTDPQNLGALHMAGVLACQTDRYDVGVALIREALRLKPDFAEAHCNLGNAFQDQGRWDVALDCYRQSLQLKPNYAEAHFNRGNVLTDLGKHEEAIAQYQQILRLQPDFAHARRGLGMTRLLLGDYEQGWPEYEWRSKCDDPVPYKQPIWDGSSLNGRKILLYSEQGLGDTLQFIRYAPVVQAKGGQVLVACPSALVRLLTNCRGIDRLIPLGNSIPNHEFDVQASLMSLPAILKTSLATVPAQVPYLFADAELTKSWRKELHQIKGFKIGIVWQGNPKYRRDFRRSFPLERFAPLGRLKGVRLLSLQKGPGAKQLLSLTQAHPGRFSVIDLGSKLDQASGAFMDSAAVMKNLDLVVTLDTAIAHLAGALGIPVWVALSFVPDWRWLLDREDSPWYPTMRLFRQSEPGNWEEVFERIAAEVKKLLAKR